MQSWIATLTLVLVLKVIESVKVVCSLYDFCVCVPLMTSAASDGLGWP